MLTLYVDELLLAARHLRLLLLLKGILARKFKMDDYGEANEGQNLKLFFCREIKKLKLFRVTYKNTIL